MTTRAQVTVAAQGTQGPPGIRWRGSYDPAAAYTVRDLVRDNDNNILYIVVTDIPANSNLLLTNEAYFDVFATQTIRSPGMQWRGDFDSTIAYAPKDLVRDPASNNVYYFNVSVAANSNPDLTDTAVADLVLRGLTVTDADIQSLNALSPYSSYLQTVAGVAADVGNVGPIASDVTTVALNSANVTTVATNLGQGVNSEVVIVGDNIASVNTVATEINDNASPLNTALSNATSAASNAGAAATSASNAATSETNAGTSASSAAISESDARKLAVNAHNTQYTLDDGSTGYSALHYSTEALATLANVNSKLIGSFTTLNLPVSATVGAIAYDTTESRLRVWNGTQWLLGLEGPQGISGGGITNLNYDAASDTLTITYDTPGTAQANDARIGNQDIDFGANKILYSNSYASAGVLPNAVTYPGMVAVANNIPYYSANSTWKTFSTDPEVLHETVEVSADTDYVTFSQLPDYVKKIRVVVYAGNATTNHAKLMVQIGTTGSYLTTGYDSAVETNKITTPTYADTTRGFIFTHGDDQSLRTVTGEIALEKHTMSYGATTRIVWLSRGDFMINGSSAWYQGNSIGVYTTTSSLSINSVRIDAEDYTYTNPCQVKAGGIFQIYYTAE